MKRDAAYSRDLISVLDHIHSITPADLAGRFRDHSGLAPGDYMPIGISSDRRVAAIDGSNTLVAESGLFSVIALRAAGVVFRGGRRESSVVSPVRVLRIGPKRDVESFPLLYQECFDTLPEASLDSEDRAKAAGVLRDIIEYWTVLGVMERLDGGDLILLDGALRVNHESLNPVLMEILKKAGRQGLLVASVTKRTSMTWGGGIPLVPSVAALARECGVDPPWTVRIPDAILDASRYEQWQHGELYVARLHPASPAAFKVELPQYADADAVQDTFAACAAYADDGRVTGYPFPLFAAHRQALIKEDASDLVLQDLIRGMGAINLGVAEYREIFGDIHDEFARYS